MAKLAFGELELAILKIIGDLKRATVGDVYRQLGQKRSYTTTMTVMSRLAKKGALAREKEGKRYVYWLTDATSTFSKGILERIRTRVFGGKSAAMVSYLIDMDHDLSEDELRALEKVIREKRRQQKDER